MNYIYIISFLISFAATWAIMKFQSHHEHHTLDNKLLEPQKIHLIPVPRIGGLAILIGLIFALVLYPSEEYSNKIIISLILCSSLIFFVGFYEDITKKVSVRTRLILTSTIVILFVFLTPAKIDRLDITTLDSIFTYLPFLGIIFTIFAITGLINAYNIIDGCNGLSSMTAVITLSSLGYLSYIHEDVTLLFLCITAITAILGFFLWNFPYGTIFLGDGGAYLLGFLIAGLTILLIQRHSDISPWFGLLINIYPVTETIFTIIRRKIYQTKNIGTADRLHFHTLIYRRLARKKFLNTHIGPNSYTSIYMWTACISGIIPALLFWNNKALLIISGATYILAFNFIYRRIIKFKVPKFLL